VPVEEDMLQEDTTSEIEFCCTRTDFFRLSSIGGFHTLAFLGFGITFSFVSILTGLFRMMGIIFLLSSE
jgi:hypothetical protein